MAALGTAAAARDLERAGQVAQLTGRIEARTVQKLEEAQISPQVGILVNGVPLRRAVSIGRHESALTSTAAGALGIDGEYEYLGSDTVIMYFSMGDAYEGTPSIVLVTPEKPGPSTPSRSSSITRPRRTYCTAAVSPSSCSWSRSSSRRWYL